MRVHHGKAAVSLTEQYVQHCSVRPPLSDLTSIAAKFDKRAILPAEKARLLADVLIDTAMREPERSAAHLESAAARLNEVIQEAEQLYDRGMDSAFDREAANLAAALMRRAEIPLWQAAALGTPAVHAYDGLLGVLSEVLPLAGYSNAANERATEMIPLLLGARGMWRSRTGWYGRMALAREYAGKHANMRTISSWSTGIYFTADAASFDVPPVKASVKRPDSQHSTGRNMGPGVVLLRSDHLGFDDPETVLWSCVSEYDGEVPDGVAEDSLLDAAQLDGVTDVIWEKIEEHRATTN